MGQGAIVLPCLMMEALVRTHDAERHRRFRPVVPKRRKGSRERLGWALVDLGLRLAATHRAVAVADQGCAC